MLISVANLSFLMSPDGFREVWNAAIPKSIRYTATRRIKTGENRSFAIRYARDSDVLRSFETSVRLLSEIIVSRQP